MRRKFAGITFVCIGAVLILSALLLLLYTTVTDAVMAQENRDVYEELVRIAEEKRIESTSSTDVMPQEQTGIDHENMDTPMKTETDAAETEYAAVAYTPMSVVRIGEFDYVGFLDIPALSLSLPVLAESDEESLKAAPCRQFGAPETNDFVIAGHNYRRHFANLYKLKTNDTVQFSDMDGDTVSYKVAVVTTVDAIDVDAVINTPYALVLYTCDYTGNHRIAVFCERE